MSVEYRALRLDEREACLDLWGRAFPETGRDYFGKYFYGDVEWLPYYTQVAVEGGTLVSAVHICKRVVACGAFRLTMGGIANVGTLPSARGKGYSSACLKRAIAVMEADAMDFSLLFTGIHSHYSKQGFDRMPQPRLSGTLRPERIPASNSLALRPAAPDDVAAVRALYDEYNARRPLAVQRNEAYWRDWVGISEAHVPSSLFVAVSPTGDVVGYVRAHFFDHDGGGVRVEEIGMLTLADAETVTTMLLDEAARLALANGGRKFEAALPLEPSVTEALEDIVGETTHTPDTGGMARLLHRANLLQSFAMEWNDRWIAAGRPSGTLAFATPYGTTVLDATGAFLRVQPTDNAPALLSQTALFTLLFGLATVAQTVADTTLHPLLNVLFASPPLFGTFWEADGF